MFSEASSFNNDLSSWDVSSVARMDVSTRSLEYHVYKSLYYLYIYTYLYIDICHSLILVYFFIYQLF